MENHSQDLNQIVHQLLVTMDSKLEEMKAQIQGLPTPASESSSSPRHVTTETYQAPTDLLCSMRMDVLRFDGSDPEGWVFRVEEFFNFFSTPEEMRLKIVSFHMEGPAAAWYQWMKNNQLLKSWKEFLVSLKLRFGSSDYEDYEGRLSKLTQKTTVAEFQTEFEGLMNKVTGISETLLISFFVAGLKHEIGREMLMNRPTSLMEAFRVARAHEARFEDARVSMHYGPKGPFNPSPNQACNLRNPQINPPAPNPMTHPVSMTHPKPNITCPNPRPPSPSSTFSSDEGEEGDDSSNKNDKSKEIKKWPMFADLGGLRGVIDELIKEVIVPFHHPQLARHLQVKPITGILLHGPPGCGKTTLAEAIANETGVPFHKISAAELVSGCTGASERKIQELFSKANGTAPSIVFIDEIDAIASKREKLRGTGPRIVTQLITSMDESRKLVKPVDKNGGSGSSNCKPGYVLVIGATNRPDVIDRALRRPGRFDREILLGVPDESARIQILSKLTCNCKVEGALDLAKIGSSTPGFVGADLRALCDKAGNLAMNRIMDQRKVELSKEQKDSVCSEDYWRPPVPDEEMESLSITMADFEEAVKLVQPSSKREGFSEIPNVKWDDVGGLHLLRKEFERHIIRRIKSPEIYEDLGLDLPTGFLLYGPPGCGKTLIAKAVANEAGANFIHIKGPEILDKYVGETERAVRTIFSRARTCAPCIIFFDEVDALTRKNDRNHGSGLVVQQLVAQLLIELDGGVQRKDVYVIGATNRPEVMNTAVLRPGRFGKLVYVPLPSRDERGMILKALARNKPIDANVDLMALGKDSACDNFSGADLSALMHEAAMESLDDRLVSPPPWTIKDVHFKRALEKISPSVSDEQIEYYKLLSKTLRAAQG